MDGMSVQADHVERGDLRCGSFIAPFSRRFLDTTRAIQREFEIVEYLDELGYDEAWIGEHHSGGAELIGSPELFIAGAVERTKRIKLGTGVISLPYHNPLMVADRMVQLDHQARGRAMFGFGPGLLPSDARMLGIPDAKRRDRLVEGLDVILRLLAGERVTYKCEWFELDNAQLQMAPYSRPRPHISIASAVTPSGGKLAGTHGLGMLGMAAASAHGFGALGSNWDIAERQAQATGQRVSRREYRLVAPFHVAHTRELALAECKHGFAEFEDYVSHINAEGPVSLGMASPEQINENGMGAIGTPDDAVRALERFWEQSGGFGCILHFHHPWADIEATKRSYRLFIDYVMPTFARRNAWRMKSLDWLGANVDAYEAASNAAREQAIAKHLAESEQTDRQKQAANG